MSRYAFAYRSDVGVHDAIEYLYGCFQERQRAFLVEFDFSKFFDCVDHVYLLGVLDKCFRVTNKERALVRSFLEHEKAYGEVAYRDRSFVKNGVGIPQGNSLSLFLANVLCVTLDKAMERIGVTFVRYADDTVILTESIEKAHAAAATLSEFSAEAGAPINFKKSDGISVLTPEALGSRGETDASLKSSFDFLGHRFSYALFSVPQKPSKEVRHLLSIRRSSESKIRTRVAEVIYNHLLLYPQKGALSAKRIASGVDWDLVRCVNDLRSLTYGFGVKEQQIAEGIESRDVKLLKLKSVANFFPLVDDVAQLQKLDGWMVHILFAALLKRKVLAERLLSNVDYPSVTKEQLKFGSWYPSWLAREVPNETRLPSFVRAWQYSRKGLKIFDLRQFRQGGSLLDVYFW